MYNELTFSQLKVFDGERDDGGVLLDEELVLGEPRQVENEVRGQPLQGVAFPGQRIRAYDVRLRFAVKLGQHGE